MNDALGPYRLLERIAVGGMAEVFRAVRQGASGFEKPVAVKRLLPELAADPAFAAMFADEARLMARLSHPNLVQVFDYGAAEGQPYLVLELVSGETLAQTLTRRGALPPPIALFVAAEVLGALAYVHGVHQAEVGIVHRDVTPGNVFLGAGGAVKLGDFGVAKAQGRRTRTQRGQLKGTLAYMAPEQARGEDVDGRADLYAVGLIIYEMLTGRPFRSGETETDLLRAALDPPEFSPAALPPEARDVEGVLARVLRRSPDGRPASAGEVERELRQLLVARAVTVGPADVAALLATPAPEATAPSVERPAAGSAPPKLLQPAVETPEAHPAGRVTALRPPPPVRRRRWPALIVAAVAVAALAMGILAFAGRRERADAGARGDTDAAVTAALTIGAPSPPASAPPTAPPPRVGLAAAAQPDVEAPASTSTEPVSAAASPRRRFSDKPARMADPASAVTAPTPVAAAPGASSVDQGSGRPAESASGPVAVDAARKARGLLVGDAPRCDLARARAQTAPSAEAEAAAEQAIACYRGMVIDRAFLDGKMSRAAVKVAAAARDRDPQVQERSKAILDLAVAGRHDEANRLINDLLADLR